MLLRYLLLSLFLNSVLGLSSLDSRKHAKRDLSDSYIVVLEQEAELDRLIGPLGDGILNKIVHRYTHALNGFSGTFTALEVKTLRALPAVKYIEQDMEVYSDLVQTHSTYGLAITSQKQVLPPKKQNTYYYKPAKGAVTVGCFHKSRVLDSEPNAFKVYVIDTGIDISHPQFGGRASFAKDFTGEGKYDGEGHGTHVSGTIGSKSYGVFKQAKLVAVKVLNSDGSGTLTGIIAGMDWVHRNHKDPSVVNMSLGASTVVRSLNDAARALYDAGITVVVSAGNAAMYGQTACDLSPSSEPSAITVGAIDKTYTAADFSGQDSCVDINAPGVDVLSTFPGNKTHILSGTSMSTPHVTGVAAYLISQYGLTKPSDVLKTILRYAEKGVVKKPRGAPNVLANNGFFQ